MKRRKFILKSILAGLGVTLIPKLAFSNSKFISIFYIGEVNQQNRHGNLFSENSYSINHFVFKSISRSVFYKNGTSPSKDDAYSISLKDKQNNLHSYFVLDDKVIKTKGNKTLFIGNKDIINGCELSFIIGHKELQLSRNQTLVPFNKSNAEIIQTNRIQYLNNKHLILS